MKKYLLAGMLIILLAAILAMSLSAAEKESVKIKLPDGLYMYDSGISKREDGREWVGFRTFFVVQNNIIYSAQDALRKFGVSKLNKLFTENKKYKILFGGEKIGEIYNVTIGKFNNEVDWNYKEELFTKNIKQGPAYGRESIYLGRLGSAVKFIAVPKEYKEIPKKVYTTIPQEEVDKIAKLIQNKLFDLVKNRKEITEYQLKHTELSEEYIELLDKISDRNGDLYLGIYRYIFKIEKGSRKFTPFLKFALEIALSVKEDNVYLITSDYDGKMAIYGMLDFDGCGEEELFIEKVFSTEDTATITKEIYKQKSDGSWLLINKIKN